jgi:PAS domain S-box-containing protein
MGVGGRAGLLRRFGRTRDRTGERDAEQARRDTPEASRGLANELEDRVRKRPTEWNATVTQPLLPIGGGAHAGGVPSPASEIEDVVVHEMRERLAAIVESSTDAVLTTTLDLFITSWNAAAERLLGYAVDEVIGLPVVSLVLPERVEEARAIMERAQKGERFSGFETIWKMQDGTLVEVSLSVFPITNEVVGNEIACIARDLTSQRQTESDLRQGEGRFRALSSRLLTVREEERARIARDIHDILGQKLIAMRLDTAYIAKSLEHAGQMQVWSAGSLRAGLVERARAIASAIDEVLPKVGELVGNLRPGILDSLGLFPTIEWELGQFEQRTGVRAELRTTLDELPIDEAAATAAYRILQETLTNTARHAHASRVRVSLLEDSSHVSMIIEDDGGGITDSEVESVRSLGLIGMHERARIVNGSLAIGRGQAGGTVVTLTLPKRREYAP